MLHRLSKREGRGRVIGISDGRRDCSGRLGSDRGRREAQHASPLLYVQAPGRTGEGQQCIAQHHWPDPVVRRQQREGVQGIGFGAAAEPVAGAPKHMVQRTAHRRLHGIGHAHLDHLQQQIPLGLRRLEFDQGVAAVAGHRDVLR